MSLKLKAYLIVLAYGLLAGLAALTLDKLGYLESIELKYYDRLVRSQNPEKNSEIVLCKVTEQDYRNYNLDHMRDDLLSEIIAKLQASSPSIIGIDFIKDRKVGDGSDNLKAVFDKGNVVGVLRLGGEIGAEPNASYPYVLDCSQVASQTGFADLELDDIRQEVVRRVALYAPVTLPKCSTDSEDYKDSFSLGAMLALRVLHRDLKVQANQLKNFSTWLWEDLYNSEINSFVIGKNKYKQFVGNEGGYSRASQNFEYLIDFSEDEHSFDSFSLTELMENKVDSLRINNKIVVVGATAESKKDSYPTPRSDWSLGRGKMPGMTIHAIIASQILRGFRTENTMIHTHSQVLEYLWIMLWGILGAGIASSLLIPLRSIIGVAIALLFLTISTHLLFSWSWWLPFIAPSLSLVLAALMFIIFHSRYRRQTV